MAGSEQRRNRTKWDAKAEATRERLIEEGIARILEEAASAIAALVTPSALARRSGAASVDTAYRLLGGPEQTLLLLTARSIDPDFRSEAIGWDTFDEVSAGAVDRFADAQEQQPLEASLAALRHYIESNFHLPSYPISRILAAVSLTASERWEGVIRVPDEHRDFAVALRDAQRDGWAGVREHMRWMVQDAFAAMRRRPRAGMSVDKILLLLYALADGAIDRMALYPELLTVDEVVMAVLALGIALSEEGSLADPRLPADPDAEAAFTRVVEVADARWAGGEVDDLRAIAEDANEPFEAIVVMFPTVEHLADSVVRARVQAVGIDEGAEEPAAALIVSALRRLARTADELPEALAHASRLDGPDSVLYELRGAIRATSQPDGEDASRVDRLAEQIVANACMGTAQWGTVEVLLEALLPRGSR